MSAASDARAEIQGALDALAPVHEGLRDYARLNLEADTRSVVDQAIHIFNVRVSALEVARDALDALLGDGHPEMPARDAVSHVYQDLQRNKETIEAAFALFRATPEPATGFTFAVGDPVPK